MLQTVFPGGSSRNGESRQGFLALKCGKVRTGSASHSPLKSVTISRQAWAFPENKYSHVALIERVLLHGTATQWPLHSSLSTTEDTITPFAMHLTAQTAVHTCVVHNVLPPTVFQLLASASRELCVPGGPTLDNCAPTAVFA